jgi:hypothetical protein
MPQNLESGQALFVANDCQQVVAKGVSHLQDPKSPQDYRGRKRGGEKRADGRYTAAHRRTHTHTHARARGGGGTELETGGKVVGEFTG